MDTAKKGPSAARRMDTKKMAILAMMAALAYVVMLVGRVPIVLWLKYDPKDVVIAIAAFIYGPMAGVGISIVDSLIEMLTASDTGIWGFIMNVLSTCSLVVPAALIYHRHHTIKGAVLGLIVGSVLCVAAMLLWNWLVTPFYMGQPREAVEELLRWQFQEMGVQRVWCAHSPENEKSRRVQEKCGFRHVCDTPPSPWPDGTERPGVCQAITRQEWEVRHGG